MNRNDLLDEYSTADELPLLADEQLLQGDYFINGGEGVYVGNDGDEENSETVSRAPPKSAAERKKPPAKKKQTPNMSSEDKANKKKEKEANDRRKKPWKNIFAMMKLIVSMEPRNKENNEMTIRFADDEFFNNFGFDRPDSLPMPLRKITGPATARAIMFQIQNAVSSRQTLCAYVNFQSEDGIPLSCHVNVVSLTPPPGVIPEERWAVLTIRSASSVGNSRQYALGLLGTERVPEQRLRELPSNKVVVRKNNQSSNK